MAENRPLTADRRHINSAREMEHRYAKGKLILFLVLAFVCASCGGGEGKEENAEAAEDAAQEGEGMDGSRDDGGEFLPEGSDPIDEEGAEGDATDGEGTDAPSDGDAGEGETPMDASALCLTLTEAYCEYILGCCSAGERALLAAAVDCGRPSESAFFHDCYVRYASYVGDGTAVIDESSLPECLAIFDGMASSCPDFQALPIQKEWYMEMGCGAAVRGTLDPGAECESSEQCAGSYYCDAEAATAACLPRGAAGAECGDNDECMPGGVCIAGECASPSRAGDLCDDEGDCNQGLYCNTGYGICSGLLDAGVECDPAADLCAGRCPDAEPHTCVAFCDGD